MHDTPYRPSAATPLGIWPCDPAPGEDKQLPELVEHVTPALLRRVLYEYAQPGATVALAGIDPAAPPTGNPGDFDVAALPATGHGAPHTPARPGQPVHGAHSGTPPAAVGLIVAAVADPARADPDTYQRWRARLRPGGVLVVLTACPAGAVKFANNAGLIVTDATAAGLAYQQHIVAIHARMTNDRLLTPPGPAHAQDVAGPVVQRRVHSDVLVFTNPPPVADEDNPGGRR